jgi:hypothetical protein
MRHADGDSNINAYEHTDGYGDSHSDRVMYTFQHDHKRRL